MSAVITGLGVVSAAGCGRDAFAAALAAGEVRTSEVDRSDGYHRSAGARRAALVDADLAPWLPRGAGRRMSTPSKLAVTAARLALADAGVEADVLGRETTAVVLATAFGPSAFTERILLQVFQEGPEAVSPFLFTESVANAPAAQIGLLLKATGPNITVTERSAGAPIAVWKGARAVETGRAERALVGAVEELNPLLHAVLDRFGALAGSRAGRDEVARPFDRRRSGVLAGEGATVALVERAEAAEARGARPLAAVRAGFSAFDPSASAVSWPRHPDVLAGALADGLSRAGLTAADVDLVVSGAAGAIGGDRIEALVLRRVWGETPLPPVIAPKAVTGEHGGGLLAGAFLAAAGAALGPTPGFAEVDPELGLEPHRGGDLPAPEIVLVSALGPGGSAAWLLLEACR